MKNLKNILAAITLVAFLMIGTAKADDGIVITELTGNNSQTCDVKDNTNWGIVITEFTGIVITEFTGIVITEFTANNSAKSCGIILND